MIKKFIIPAAIVVGILFLRIFVFFFANIPSGSMIPSIEIGDKVIANKLDRNFHRGDVVIFPFPDNEETLYIKRIIGEPGDKVEIKEGVTFINDTALQEDYLAEKPTGSFGPFDVPEDSYFVMGDNRNHSLDARYWTNKFVTEEKIIGKAFFVWFPHVHPL